MTATEAFLGGLADHFDQPGNLFGYLWSHVAPKVQVLISAGWMGKQALECRTLTTLITKADRLPKQVEDYLFGREQELYTEVLADKVLERAFVVMCALDEAAALIHPGIVTRAGGTVISPLGSMLRIMRDRRWVDGVYGYYTDVGAIVPKGPLVRRRFHPEADTVSGDRLAPQFDYLTAIAPLPSHHALDIQVLTPSLVGTDNCWDKPKVALAPIAEDANDLSFAAIQRGSGTFLDVFPAASLAVSERVIAAVERALTEGCSVVMLPELCLTPDALEHLSERLRSRNNRHEGLQIVVLGSCVSREVCDEQKLPFNESVVMDATGEILWRQRKIHHFRMGADRMRECRVTSPRPGSAHCENVASGKLLCVRDIPLVGRVVVLICEDLEQAVPEGDAVMALAPDWVFSPVLDVNQKVGRWTHQRAIEIGRVTASRFIIANSTCLSVRSAGKTTLAEMEPAMVGLGLCVDGTDKLRFKLVTLADADGDPLVAIIDWRSHEWPRHRVVEAVA